MGKKEEKADHGGQRYIQRSHGTAGGLRVSKNSKSMRCEWNIALRLGRVGLFRMQHGGAQLASAAMLAGSTSLIRSSTGGSTLASDKL